MNKNSLFNSALLTITLAVLAWIGLKTTATSEGLASLCASVLAGVSADATSERANAEAHGRIERLLSDSVSRREFDTRLLAIEAQLGRNEVHLREIDIELLKLKQKPL